MEGTHFRNGSEIWADWGLVRVGVHLSLTWENQFWDQLPCFVQVLQLPAAEQPAKLTVPWNWDTSPGKRRGLYQCDQCDHSKNLQKFVKGPHFVATFAKVNMIYHFLDTHSTFPGEHGYVFVGQGQDHISAGCTSIPNWSLGGIHLCRGQNLG